MLYRFDMKSILSACLHYGYLFILLLLVLVGRHM
jgi:hypothetical protein